VAQKNTRHWLPKRRTIEKIGKDNGPSQRTKAHCFNNEFTTPQAGNGKTCASGLFFWLTRTDARIRTTRSGNRGHNVSSEKPESSAARGKDHLTRKQKPNNTTVLSLATMEPGPALKPSEFAAFSEKQYQQTQGKIERKIVRRGQHAASVLRKWLYAGKHHVKGGIPGFVAPLSHEEFIQASHLAFLAHDDAYLKWTNTAKTTIQKWGADIHELHRTKNTEAGKERISPMTRKQLKKLIWMDIGQHNLPHGVKYLLVESRMLQEDFRNVVQAETDLRRLENKPETDETTQAKRQARELIEQSMAHIRAQHAAVVTFNAAQAHSYFVQRRGAQKFNRLGVLYWPLAALALYGPYLEKGGLEKQGASLSNAALIKAYPGIHRHIQSVKDRFQADIARKKRQWPIVAKNAIGSALQSDRERTLKGESPLYPDMREMRLSIEPMVEKSNASLYRTFGSKTPDGHDHYKDMADVHDIMRSRIIVDEADKEKAIRACRQVRLAIENHLQSAAFPLQSIIERKDRLEKPKQNRFRSLILELHFGKYPESVRGLPRAELQILTRAMHRQNERPQSARVPRWMYFSGLVPKRRITKLLGIPASIRRRPR